MRNTMMTKTQRIAFLEEENKYLQQRTSHEQDLKNLRYSCLQLAVGTPDIVASKVVAQATTYMDFIYPTDKPVPAGEPTGYAGEAALPTAGRDAMGLAD